MGQENVNNYQKRALWGWDVDNFNTGNEVGVFQIDNRKMGVRICYEVRFPEYFRELFKLNTEIIFVVFSDVSKENDLNRYNLIMSHLRTRAVENAVSIISVNSISNFQTAPTCIINPDGNIVFEAERNIENVCVVDYEMSKMNFGREGRIVESKKLTSAST